MIDELDRLRESNPVPWEVTPAPIDHLLARIAEDGSDGRRHPRRARRARLVSGVVPLLGGGMALAVAVLAIVLLGQHRHAATAPASRGPVLAVPARGMPGVLMVGGATFGRGGTTISLSQCLPCAVGTPAGEHIRAWRLTSTDGGGSWNARHGQTLETAQFSGPEDGWADASIDPQGTRDHHAYVTHDGGRTWTLASTPAGWSVGEISVAGGTVWATATRGDTATLLLRGPAAGNALSPVASQPVATPPLVVAAGKDTAYLDVAHGINRVQHLVTQDGGRTWQRLPKFCPLEGADRTLTADSPMSLWRFCWNGRGRVLLGRSTDGGHTYRSYRVPAPGPRGAPYRFQAVSGQVAWELTDHGDVIRVTRGGSRSQVVWWRSRSQRTLANGVPEALTVRSAAVAYVTVVVPPVRGATGSNIVIYATNDGGRTWQAHVVRLPTALTH